MNLSIHFSLLIITLILSAFFSGTESAIFSLTEYEKRKLKERHKKSWLSLKQYLDNSTETISLIITGNTLVNTVATTILGILISEFFPAIHLIVSIIIVTSIILLLGEILPKLISLRLAGIISLFSVHFLSLSTKLLKPLKNLFSRASLKIASHFGIDIDTIQPPPLVAEIYALVKAGEERGILEKRERLLAEKVLDFSKRWVKEIMTPRVDISSIKYSFSTSEILEYMKVRKHTKYPVERENLDSIIGVIYVKDLLFKTYSNWRDLIQPLLTVPEFMMIDELLLEFKERNEEIALIVDEYGGTSGLVTLEDILEELVGEIEDEYRKEIRKIEFISEDTFSAAGNLSLRELKELTGIDIQTKGISTLAGLLLNLFQKIPSSGQSIEYKGLKFFIDEVSKNRIKKLTVKKIK